MSELHSMRGVVLLSVLVFGSTALVRAAAVEVESGRRESQAPPGPSAAPSSPAPPKSAPYAGIRWVEGSPEVLLDGAWWPLESLDGRNVAAIVAFARQRYGDRWQKRFDEDIVDVLGAMGRAPGSAVTLVVRNTDGHRRTLESVAMTTENRRAIMALKYPDRTAVRPTAPQAPARIEGSHPARVEPSAVNAALDAFKAILDERWSYRHANGVDFGAAVEALRARAAGGMDAGDFGLELRKIIALGIDGHASISGFDEPKGGCLPFLIEPVGDRFVAFAPDRSGFLAEGMPFITAIDGEPIEEWCRAAAVFVPQGSPQFVRRQALRQWRAIDLVRREKGVTARGSVTVEVASKDGSARRALTLPVAAREPAYGEWPRGESRLIDERVGYLRLRAMNDDAVAQIREWMPRFEKTDGLIVDVRDNGGGSRDALVELARRLADPHDPPRVVCTAAYRLHPEIPRDHLARRFMYRADDARWSDAQRAAIEVHRSRFKPSWSPPAGDFSEWHFMVLGGEATTPDAPRYARPVVILMNAKCFSATDVFLAALGEFPSVTLMGTPSGGGSAFGQAHRLGDTRYEARLGSMASFLPDGRLFDGHGVTPDVVVEPSPESFIGGRDEVLDAAVKRLTRAGD